MAKSPEMQKFCDARARRLFGRDSHTTTGGQRTIVPHCPICGSTKVNSSDFSDDLSRREFEISGMCRECQESVFADEDPLNG